MKKGIYSVTFGVNVENEQSEIEIVQALIKDLNRMISLGQVLPEAVVEYMHESDDDADSGFEGESEDDSSDESLAS